MSKQIVKSLKFKKVDGFDYGEFSKMIDKAYNDRRRDKRDMKKKTFSPSTVGYGHGNCPRYWFIAFSGAEFDEKFDATAIANMLNGTYAHERLQKIIEETGVLKEIEREIVSEDPPIRGFADLILDWNDTEIVGEIKTTKDESFAHRQASMKPSSNHLLQILTTAILAYTLFPRQPFFFGVILFPYLPVSCFSTTFIRAVFLIMSCLIKLVCASIISAYHFGGTNAPISITPSPRPLLFQQGFLTGQF